MPNIGKQVLARIGQGVAKPGKSAPWVLINAADTSADVEKATAYLAGEIVKGASEQPTTGLTVTPEIQALIDKLGAKPF